MDRCIVRGLLRIDYVSDIVAGRNPATTPAVGIAYAKHLCNYKLRPTGERAILTVPDALRNIRNNGQRVYAITSYGQLGIYLIRLPLNSKVSYLLEYEINVLFL